MHTKKRKNKTKKAISPEYAKKIGEMLKYGSKDSIAERVRCRKNYVRYILMGNGGKSLKTATQLLILSIAVEFLQAQLAESRSKFNELAVEIESTEKLLTEYTNSNL